MYENAHPNRNNSEGVSLPKTRRGQATFNKLLKAAEEIIGEKGYHDTSISAITEQAGVAMGTFYLYFRSKKDIFRELIYYVHHDLRKYIQVQIKEISDRKEAEVEGFKAFYRYCLRHPHLYALIREAEFVDIEIFKWHYTTFARTYADNLTAAMAKGEVKQMDPETLAFCLMGISIFTGMRWSLWEEQLPGEDQMNTVREFILNGIAPEQ
jgi:AcrR family transcriptional regulator